MAKGRRHSFPVVVESLAELIEVAENAIGFSNLLGEPYVKWGNGDEYMILTERDTMELLDLEFDDSGYVVNPMTLKGQMIIADDDGVPIALARIAAVEDNVKYLRQQYTSSEYGTAWQDIDYDDIVNTPDLSDYVPYTSGDKEVDLNTQDLVNVGALGVGTDTPTSTWNRALRFARW